MKEKIGMKRHFQVLESIWVMKKIQVDYEKETMSRGTHHIGNLRKIEVCEW